MLVDIANEIKIYTTNTQAYTYNNKFVLYEINSIDLEALLTHILHNSQ